MSFNRYNTAPHFDPQLLFSGQYYDQESGLAYNRFRYYDPETANYLSPDPIGLLGGQTPYVYVPNPLDWVDWFGLSGCWATARRNFWINEAMINSNKYSQRNLDRMSKGLSPKIQAEVFEHSKRTIEIKDFSLELHHKKFTQIDIPIYGISKVHSFDNLEIVTPWEHSIKDPYRHTGNTLISIIKGVDIW